MASIVQSTLHMSAKASVSKTESLKRQRSVKSVSRTSNVTFASSEETVDRRHAMSLFAVRLDVLFLFFCLQFGCKTRLVFALFFETRWWCFAFVSKEHKPDLDANARSIRRICFRARRQNPRSNQHRFWKEGVEKRSSSSWSKLFALEFCSSFCESFWEEKRDFISRIHQFPPVKHL